MPSHRDTARQFPWDRLPVSAGFGGDLNFVAGAAAWYVQATYTVPANRKASVDGYTMSMVCVFAGAGGTWNKARMGWTFGGFPVYVGSLGVNGNIVGDSAGFSVGAGGWAQAGEVFTAEAYTSGGLNVQHLTFGLKVTECLV